MAQSTVTPGVAYTINELNRKRRYDYTGRSDGQPVYIGWATKGLAEDADGWLILKHTYDGSDQLSEVNIAYGKWSERASYTTYD